LIFSKGNDQILEHAANDTEQLCTTGNYPHLKTRFISVRSLTCVVCSRSEYFDNVADRLSADGAECAAVLHDVASAWIAHAHVTARVEN